MYLYRNVHQNENVLTITPQAELNNDAFAKLLNRATHSETDYLHPSISVNIASWRNASAIHQWLIAHCADNIDNHQDINVSLESLHDLKDTCERILNAPNDTSLINRLLPPQKSIALKEYLEDVIYTNDMLAKEFKIADEFKAYKTPAEATPEKSVTAIDIDYTYRTVSINH